MDVVGLEKEYRQTENSLKHENSYSELRGSVLTPKFGKFTLERNESTNGVKARNCVPAEKCSLIYLEMYLETLDVQKLFTCQKILFNTFSKKPHVQDLFT